MRKLFLGAVALAAIAIPTAAHAEASGDLNIGYSNFDTDDDFSDGSIQYGGAANISFSNGWNLQVDAQNNRIDFGPGDVTLTQGAAHAFYRTEGWAAGGFVSYGDLAGEAVYGLGAEGALFLGQFNLNGSIETISFDNADVDDSSAITLGGAFFITDNLQVGASTQFVDLAGDEFNNWLIDGEWRIGASPFSIYGSYQMVDEERFGEEVNVFTIGGRWNFGTGSLLERSRSGAGMQRGSNFSEFMVIPAF